MRPNLSIIIVSFNTCEMTCQCIDSILRAAAAEAYEIIVVDNDSRDGSAEQIAVRYPAVTLIRSPRNLGFAAANNLAFPHATGRHVLLLNSDTLILKDVLQQSVAYMDAHPDVGVLGCRVLNTDFTLQPTCGGFPSFLNLALMTFGLDRLHWPRWCDRYRLLQWDRRSDRDVTMVTGCYMMIRREALDHVGPMDEGFFFYGEETDWCVRAAHDGWKVRFACTGQIVHHGSGSSRRLNHRRDVLLSRGLVRLNRKHRGLAAAVATWILLLAFNASRCVVHAARAAIGPTQRRLAQRAFRKSRPRILRRVGMKGKHMPASIVILAPYVDQADVGESRSAHRWVAELSRRIPVTLLCHRRRGQAPIAPTLPHTTVVEWPEPGLLRRFERLDSMMKPGLALYYFRARAWLRAALRRGERIDLIHQLSPLAIRYPSPAGGLDIPYILGPLGGSLPTPAPFAHEVRDPWYTRLRRLDALRLRFDPFLRRTIAGAACVIGVAPYVHELLVDNGLRPRQFAAISETAADDPFPPAPRDPGPIRADRPLRALYVGRVVRTKGVRDAVRAMKRLAGRPVTLDVVGAGNDLAACRSEAVGAAVVFHGHLPRAQIEAFYRRADVFVFPSFREPSGNVVFESMRHGLPIICARRGGPGHVVTDSTGIRLDVTHPDDFASQIATALVALCDDSTRNRMATAARDEISRHHTWGTRIAQMVSLYESITHTNHPRPLATLQAAPHPGHLIRRRALDPTAPPSPCPGRP